MPVRLGDQLRRRMRIGRRLPRRHQQQLLHALTPAGWCGLGPLRRRLDLYEQEGWSWAYWAFREWDVMNIERTADPADKQNHPDTPLLRLFKTYFAKDKQFLTAE